MSNFSKIISLVLISILSNLAWASNDRCNVTKYQIYNLFKAYRSDVYNDVSKAEMYFSSSFFDYYKKRMKGAESHKIVKKQYIDNLKIGLSIKKVYQVELECFSEKSLDLIMGVNFYFGDWSPKKETSFGLFKFRYVKEGGAWKIDSMSTSVWKKDTMKINAGHVIDNFIVKKVERQKDSKN